MSAGGHVADVGGAGVGGCGAGGVEELRGGAGRGQGRRLRRGQRLRPRRAYFRTTYCRTASLTRPTPIAPYARFP
ncbi:hypothetical protein DF268_40470 [Streptomyces sp. V2]|nr:hypothetical protein DF268_40470 [Streptomyces sp. V2]